MIPLYIFYPFPFFRIFYVIGFAYVCQGDNCFGKGSTAALTSFYSIDYCLFKGINRLEIYSSDVQTATLTNSTQSATLNPSLTICQPFTEGGHDENSQTPFFRIEKWGFSIDLASLCFDESND
jgi:hypothetical protein